MEGLEVAPSRLRGRIQYIEKLQRDTLHAVLENTTEEFEVEEKQERELKVNIDDYGLRLQRLRMWLVQLDQIFLLHEILSLVKPKRLETPSAATSDTDYDASGDDKASDDDESDDDEDEARSEGRRTPDVKVYVGAKQVRCLIP